MNKVEILPHLHALFPQIHVLKYNLIQSTISPGQRAIHLSSRRVGKTHITNLINNAIKGRAITQDDDNMNMRLISSNDIVALLEKIIEGADLDDLNRLNGAMGKIQTILKDGIEKKILIDK